MKEKSPLKEHLEVALDAVIAACRVTRYVQRELDRIGQHTKDDQSPVTVADYASQAVIATRMAEVFGTFSLVAEEDADALRAPGNASLRQAVTTAAQQAWDGARDDEVLDAIDLGNHDASDASYWTLDPIDGTKGFLRGGQYAVSLALIESGEVVLGILGCPNLSADFERPFDDPDPHGCIFYASAAHGSWTLPADAPGASPDSMMPQPAREVAQMRICESVEAAHSRLDDTARIVKFLGAAGRPMRLDSQCKYAVVARGQADAYLRFSTGRGYVEKIWDHAAGKIVAEEAGVIVTDVDARPLDFSKGAGLTANRGIICAATKFHAPIRGAIEALGL
ncbi:MAG: 3'(2'),5'-bisphosphate nucleotidase [Gammaproteobacteria bacterium]|nr:3'(2'),5'-bisphosphate nucleotidase [Gammaproteobacteria bacterium]